MLQTNAVIFKLLKKVAKLNLVAKTIECLQNLEPEATGSFSSHKIYHCYCPLPTVSINIGIY